MGDIDKKLCEAMQCIIEYATDDPSRFMIKEFMEDLSVLLDDESWELVTVAQTLNDKGEKYLMYLRKRWGMR